MLTKILRSILSKQASANGHCGESTSVGHCS